MHRSLRPAHLVIVAGLLLQAACSREGSAQDVPDRASDVARARRLAEEHVWERLPADKRRRCVVSSITDGDTFRCSGSRRVRLLLVDAPERVHLPAPGLPRAALLTRRSAGDRLCTPNDTALCSARHCIDDVPCPALDYGERTGTEVREMAVPQRLNRSLQRALGAEAAEDLVNLLDGVELQRSELRAFRESMRADFATMRADWAEFRWESERQNAALRLEMTASHAALGERMIAMESRLMRWSLVFWTGAVIGIAGLVLALALG